LPNVAGAGGLGGDVGIVRRLSPRGVPTFLEKAEAPDGGTRLIVVERLARGGGISDELAEDWLRDARLATEIEHDNVLCARTIVVQKTEISIVCDLVDGERLSELSLMPLEIAIKILIDVLTGLSAIHKLKHASGPHRTKVVHAEVTPSNVLVGLDGVARLLRTCRVRAPGTFPTTDTEFLAPEVVADGHVDQRADVFSVGALLSRALTGALEPWAVPLVDVAARALEAAPEKRFPTATAMVTEFRRIAGERLATTDQVAAFVVAAAGPKIAARRAVVCQSETRLRTLRPRALGPREELVSGVQEVPAQVPVAPPPPEPAVTPEPVATLEPVAPPEAVAVPDLEPVAVPDAEAVAVPEPEPVAVPDAEAVAVPEPEAVAVPEPEPVAVPEAIAMPEPEAIPEPPPLAQAIPSITRTLPPPAFEAAPMDVLAAGFVELDESELITLPPSMPPPAETRAAFPPIPPPPSLGRWASLIAVDPGAFSLAPVVDVTVPPSPPRRRPTAAPRRTRSHRSFSFPMRESLPTFAAAALGALIGWGTLQVRSREPQLSNAVTPAPAALAMAAPRVVKAEPPVIERVTEETAAPAPKRTAEKPPTSKPSASSELGAKVEPRPRAPTRPVSKESSGPAAEAESQKTPVAPPPSLAGLELAGEFDRNVAMQALRDAGDRAHTCLARLPSGSLRIAVTFARTGTVEGAVVEGPLAGTAQGACVEAKFRPVRVPPFRGSSLTVRKTITY
jgi:hypothetical protein